MQLMSTYTWTFCAALPMARDCQFLTFLSALKKKCALRSCILISIQLTCTLDTTYRVHTLLGRAPRRTLLENANRVMVVTNTIMGILQRCRILAVCEDLNLRFLECRGDSDVARALLLAGREILLRPRDDGARITRLHRTEAR